MECVVSIPLKLVYKLFIKIELFYIYIIVINDSSNIPE